MKKLLFFLFLFLSQAPLRSSEKKESCSQDSYNFNKFYLDIFMKAKENFPQQKPENVLFSFVELLADQLYLLSAFDYYTDWHSKMAVAHLDYLYSLGLVGAVVVDDYYFFDKAVVTSLEELNFILHNKSLFLKNNFTENDKAEIIALDINEKNKSLRPWINILLKKNEYQEQYTRVIATISLILIRLMEVERNPYWAFIRDETQSSPFIFLKQMLHTLKQWATAYAEFIVDTSEKEPERFTKEEIERGRICKEVSSGILQPAQQALMVEMMSRNKFTESEIPYFNEFSSIVNKYKMRESCVTNFAESLSKTLFSKKLVKKGFFLKNFEQTKQELLKNLIATKEELERREVVSEKKVLQAQKKQEKQEKKKKSKGKQPIVPAALDVAWINKSYNVSDKSIVSSIKDDQVIIDDQKNNMLITLIIPDKEILRPTTIPAIKFDERVERWFKNPEKTLHEIGSLTPDEELGKLQAEKLHQKKLEIKRHNFAQMVDPFIMLFGADSIHIDKKQNKIPNKTLVGQLEDKNTHEKLIGVFGYAQNPKTGTWYHRFFSTKKPQEIAQTYFKGATFDLEYPPLGE